MSVPQTAQMSCHEKCFKMRGQFTAPLPRPFLLLFLRLEAFWIEGAARLALSCIAALHLRPPLLGSWMHSWCVPFVTLCVCDTL